MNIYNCFGKNIITVIFLLGLISCKQNIKKTNNKIVSTEVKEIFLDSIIEVEQKTDYKKLILQDSTYVSYGFDFPVGKPNGRGYYNAQKFQENNHLGDDWNGVDGGNTDLGDPVYAIGNGYISEVKDYKGGWGNVVRVVHLYKGKLYESLYAHCDSILVKSNRFIKKANKLQLLEIVMVHIMHICI